jgi:hypothetical protein
MDIIKSEGGLTMATMMTKQDRPGLDRAARQLTRAQARAAREAALQEDYRRRWAKYAPQHEKLEARLNQQIEAAKRQRQATLDAAMVKAVGRRPVCVTPRLVAKLVAKFPRINWMAVAIVAAGGVQTIETATGFSASTINRWARRRDIGHLSFRKIEKLGEAANLDLNLWHGLMRAQITSTPEWRALIQSRRPVMAETRRRAA